MKRDDTKEAEKLIFQLHDEVYEVKKEAMNVFKLHEDPNISSVTIHRNLDEHELQEIETLEDVLGSERKALLYVKLHYRNVKSR